MARTIAGELTLPDGTPLANAVIHLTAKRTEATRILEDVSSSFTTSSSGAYSQEVESGYYAVSVSYAAVPGTQPRRWHLGDVWVEDGDPITLTALLAANNSVADPTDAALLQMLAEAQAARDEAAQAAQDAKDYRDEAASMLASKLDASEKGQPGGVATLDSGGRVPAAQLPSYVDDVEEYADYASLPRPAETGKIYITLDTNRQYRWSGSDYIELVASPGTTDNVPEGSSNLYHTAARVRSVTLAGIEFVSSAAITASDTILSAFGKIQAKLNTLKGLAFLDKATQAQQLAGNSDDVGTTPLGVKRYVEQFGLGSRIQSFNGEPTSSPSTILRKDISGFEGRGGYNGPEGRYPHGIRVGEVNNSTYLGFDFDSGQARITQVQSDDSVITRIVRDSVNLPQSSIDNWNTAYGWGNHADAGYLTSVSWDDVEDKPAVIAAGATPEEAREAIYAVAGDDERLSDARDWTALVVSESEATDGESATPRKWSSLRVRQNAAAIALGVNQIHQDVSASHALNTNYTNTSGKPIELIYSPKGSVGLMQIKVGSTADSLQEVDSAFYNAQTFVMCRIRAIVPPGAVYRVQDDSGTNGVWLKLKDSP